MRISEIYPNETKWRPTVLGALQGSPEWRRSRLGKATGSRIADIAAKTKSGSAASRANYMAELIVERLINDEAEHFHSKAMEQGLVKEPAAREEYRLTTNQLIEEVGFIQHPTIAMSGASPDGLVGDDGIVSFKCPHAATHLELLLGGSIPTKYLLQMQWEMACLPERRWADFVDYDQRFPASMRLLIRRIERDQPAIKKLEVEVIKFLVELDEKLCELRSTYEP